MIESVFISHNEIEQMEKAIKINFITYLAIRNISGFNIQFTYIQLYTFFSFFSFFIPSGTPEKIERRKNIEIMIRKT